MQNTINNDSHLCHLVRHVPLIKIYHQKINKKPKTIAVRFTHRCVKSELPKKIVKISGHLSRNGKMLVRLAARQMRTGATTVSGAIGPNATRASCLLNRPTTLPDSEILIQKIEAPKN